jgi:beta-lactamase superfamily II metal-dependent hydrolase
MKVNKRMIAAVIMMTALLSSCAGAKKEAAPEVTGSFKAKILDTGKSDAIVLQSQNHTVIIDCGEKNDGDDVLEYLSENNIESVDYLIITHFDKDHVGGAAKVINGIEIGEIITPDYEGTSSEYEKYIKSAEKNGLTPLSLTEEISFTLDDVLYEVCPPEKTEYDETDNDYSIAVSVTHGENKLLFAGDAEEERLEEIEEQLPSKYTFLKVPHHGRYNEGSDEFFEKTSPSFAVITCSEKEMPSDKILAKLEEIGAQVYLTKDGSVSVESDGKTLTINQTK